jgi:hypothetical protein
MSCQKKHSFFNLTQMGCTQNQLIFFAQIRCTNILNILNRLILIAHLIIIIFKFQKYNI